MHQLGCDYDDLKNFKRHASKALGKVRAVYPALKIRSKPGGFDLLPCPPGGAACALGTGVSLLAREILLTP